MKTATALLVATLMLMGCQTRVIREPFEVKVPVATQCPAPPQMEAFDPMTKQLTSKDVADPGYVAQIYRATVIQLMGEIRKRDQLLDAYR